MKHSQIPNLVTVARFVMIPLVILLLLDQDPWMGILVAVIMSLAGLSDFLDGYLARLWKSESATGKFLDPLADKLLVTSALIMLVGLERVHPILIVIIICREILINGLRAVASSQGLVIAAKTAAKYKTTFQMMAIGALAIHGEYLSIDFHVLGLIFIYLSLGFSLYSAIEYIYLFYDAAVTKGHVS